MCEGNHGRRERERLSAVKLSGLAKKTVDSGGSSDMNIDEFIAKIRNLSNHNALK